MRWLIAGVTFSKICIFSNIIWAPEGLKKSYYIFVFKFQFEWSTLLVILQYHFCVNCPVLWSVLWSVLYSVLWNVLCSVL